VHGVATDRDVVVLELSTETWFRPDPASGSGPTRSFHSAAAVGTRVYVFGGHVYLSERKSLHKFDDLWCLDTVSTQDHDPRVLW
jgi:Kelch motif